MIPTSIYPMDKEIPGLELNPNKLNGVFPEDFDYQRPDWHKWIYGSEEAPERKQAKTEKQLVTEK